jgi:lipoprotein signal peptidase
MLLALDQLTKTLAQLALHDHRCEPIEGWGLTYVVNRGTWLWPDLGTTGILATHAAGSIVWAGWLAGASWYRRHYRRSAAIDWAAGFFTLAVFGNAIDRIIPGGARDWAITPIATSNLADIAVWPALALFASELVRYPPSRRLLSPDPRRWTPD